MSTNSAEINNFFKELSDIYENRHKYSLEWAFEDAQRQLDSFKAEVIDKKLKSKCKMCSEKSHVQDAFTGLQKKSKKILKKTKWYSRVFSNMFMILNFVEIILSMSLVVGLSKLSHSGEAFIESEMISFWFIMTFAFMKVAIERYQIKPRIDAWGWALYEKSSQTLLDLTLALDEEAEVRMSNQNEKNEVDERSDLEESFREFADRLMVA